MEAVVAGGCQDEFPETSKQRCLDFKWKPRYPRPETPRKKKDEVFVLDQFKDVDRKAREVTIESVCSVRDLAATLTKGMTNGLDKVRAIFTWLGSQRILSLDLGRVKIDDTVKGYLKIVQQDRSTYTELMAILCREVHVPCVVLYGPAKGVHHDVGEVGSWISSWNAVYVAEGWRFIHPQWAYSKIYGQENFDWVKLETSNGREYEHIKNHPGKEVEDIDEFFFLTDPEVFIHFCCPSDTQWQLLRVKVSVEKFHTMPYLQPAAFQSGLTFKRSQDCINTSENGECRVFITAPPESKLKVVYELYLRVDQSTDMSLLHNTENLVIQGNLQSDGVIPFFVRFISAGTFRLRLFRTHKQVKSWLCDYRLECSEPKPECFLLPYVSTIGWGPGPVAKQFGLHCFSHRDGLIVCHENKLLELSFKMTRTLHIQVQLKHNRLPDNEVMSCSKVSTLYDLVKVTVDLSEDGEYVLKVNARRESEKEVETRNVISYVIESDLRQRKYRGRDNPVQKRARQELQDAVKSGNKTVLAIAIERFRKLGTEDKADLTRAVATLEEIETREDLKFALLKNRYDKLDDAVTRAETSPRKDKFFDLVNMAIQQKDKLRMQTPAKVPPIVTKRTIADLKSYNKPSVLVHDILKAAYIVLGENKTVLDKWCNIRTLLHRRGMDGLDWRIHHDPDFDEYDVYQLAAEEHAKAILAKYDAETVGKMSPASEAVFVETYQLLARRQEARAEDAEGNMEHL